MVKQLKEDRISDPDLHSYSSDNEYLSDELKLLQMRIKLWLLKELKERDILPFELLSDRYVSPQEVLNLVAEAGEPLNDYAFAKPAGAEEKALLSEIDRFASFIDLKRNSSRQSTFQLSLDKLSKRFKLSRFEEQCLILCLASHLERKYEKLFAYMQNAPALDKPTVELAFILLSESKQNRLAARQAFDEDAPLIRYELLRLHHATTHLETNLLARELTMDERIVQFLLGSRKPDSRLRALSEMVNPRLPNPEWLPWIQSERKQIYALHTSRPEKSSPGTEGKVFGLAFDHVFLSQALAESVSFDLQQPLFVFDGQRWQDTQLPFSRLMILLIRETLLQNAVLYLRNGDALLSEAESGAYGQRQLFYDLVAEHGITGLVETSGSGLQFPSSPQLFGKNVGMPSRIDSLAQWGLLSQHYPLEINCNLKDISKFYRFPPDLIEQALREAEREARWRSPNGFVIKESDLADCCEKLFGQLCGNLAVPIAVDASWDDLILPSVRLKQLKAIVNRIKNRDVIMKEWGFSGKLPHKGMHFLFWGPAGTGKKTAATIIAHALNRRLLKVNLTEFIFDSADGCSRKFQILIRAASLSSAILLIEVADEWLERSAGATWEPCSQDGSATYLLRKLHEYEGITIVTFGSDVLPSENLLQNFQAHVRFSRPEAEERVRLWRTAIPEKAPTEDLDLAYLARNFKFTGAELQGVAEQAAQLAVIEKRPIGMRDMVSAVYEVLRQQGKPTQTDDFGIYAHYLKAGDP